MKINNSQMNVKNKNQTREKFTKNAVVRGIKTETRIENIISPLVCFPWMCLDYGWNDKDELITHGDRLCQGVCL